MKIIENSNFIKRTYYLAAVFSAVSFLLIPFSPKYGFFIFGKSISVTQVLLSIALVFLFGHLFSQIRKNNLHMHPKVLGPGILLILFVSALSFSEIITGHNFQESSLSLLSLATIFVVVLIFSFLDRKSVDLILVSSAIIGLISAVLGIIQYYFLGDLASTANYLGFRPKTIYASGFANYSSLFGTSLALLLPISWGLYLSNYKDKGVLWLSFFLIGFPAMILSFSRSALLGALIGFFILFIWSTKQGFIKKFLFSALLVCILTGIIIFIKPPTGSLSPATEKPISVLASRYTFIPDLFRAETNEPDEKTKLDEKRIYSLKDHSAYSRYAFYKTAAKMTLGSPKRFLFGYGPRSFGEYWQEFKPEGLDLDVNKPDSHSLFIEILVSGGIVAFIFFTLFILLLFKLGISFRKKEMLMVPLFAGLSGILVDGLFHNNLYSKYMWIFIGIIIAVILYNLEEVESRKI